MVVLRCRRPQWVALVEHRRRGRRARCEVRIEIAFVSELHAVSGWPMDCRAGDSSMSNWDLCKWGLYMLPLRAWTLMWSLRRTPFWSRLAAMGAHHHRLPSISGFAFHETFLTDQLNIDAFVRRLGTSDALTRICCLSTTRGGIVTRHSGTVRLEFDVLLRRKAD